MTIEQLAHWARDVAALLGPWRDLAAKADAFFASVQARYPEEIGCRPGCSLCCQADLEVMPVEALAILCGLAELAEVEREALRQATASRSGGADGIGDAGARRDECDAADRGAAGGAGGCPLLRKDRCTIYAWRPLLCRTHGLPIRYDEPEERAAGAQAALTSAGLPRHQAPDSTSLVVCCPQNFRASQIIPGDALLVAERLGAGLLVVDQLVRESLGLDKPSQTARTPVSRLVAEGRGALPLRLQSPVPAAAVPDAGSPHGSGALPESHQHAPGVASPDRPEVAAGAGPSLKRK